MPWANAHDQFITAIGGGQVPDVAEMGSTWTPEFGDIGALEPADLGGDGRFVQSLVDGATVDGTAYGIPWYAGARALIYRTDVLAAQGLSVPTTWDELLSVGRAIRDRTGMAAFGVAGNAAHYVLPMVWQNGGEIATARAGCGARAWPRPKRWPPCSSTPTSTAPSTSPRRGRCRGTPATSARPSRPATWR